MNPEQYHVTSFYAFFPICERRLEGLADVFYIKAEKLGLDGLLLLGNEGINASVSGNQGAVVDFKLFVQGLFPQAQIEFKDSACQKRPFRRFKVDIRPEIVSAGRSDLKPWNFIAKRLEPNEWQKELEANPNAVVIDTRNLYESDVGKFSGALVPQINRFSDFVNEFKKWNLPRDKKLLIYCTGGIRCEKAALQLAELGYEEVYQLSGGILKYLQELPNRAFEGECYVFDHRVAVDQGLNPSQRYGLCPHCGNPSSQELNCEVCGCNTKICRRCAKQEDLRSCSKNCAHHFRLRKRRAERNGKSGHSTVGCHEQP